MSFYKNITKNTGVGIITKTEKVNKGLPLLIPEEEWVPEEEIQGNELKVLQHPMVQKAFLKILNLHKPKHDIAFVSLCTSTRPYSNSPKWKKFKELFGDRCDLIISSNGGIIPIEFEECYPYLTYDAHGNSKYDDIYNQILFNRLVLFFRKFPYKHIIFNFRPTLRNRKAALKFRQEYFKSNIYILPSPETYEKARQNKFKPRGSYFPDLSYEVLKELENAVSYCSTKK